MENVDKKEPAPRRVGQKIKLGKDRWKLIVFAGYDPLTNKRRYKSETVKCTSKVADEKLTELQHKANTRSLVLKSKTTVNQLLDEWLNVIVAASVRPRTLMTYRRKVDTHLRPAVGDVRVSELTPKRVQEIYTSLKDKRLEPRSIAFIHHLLGSALRQAVKWKLITENPAAETIRPKIGRKEMRYLKPEEAVLFLECAQGDELNSLFIVALDTGMRPEEYLGLQWPDINFVTGIINVRRKLEYFSKDDWSFEPLKSERAYRTIQIASSTLRALLGHKREQDKQRLTMGANYLNHSLVFAAKDGNAMSQVVVREHFKAILERAEIDTRIRLYDLRHSSATLLLADGVDTKTLSERLGHSDEGFTLKTYAHVLPSMRARAAESMEKSVFSRVGKRFANSLNSKHKAKVG